jgi:hypothetical protein
MNHTKCYSIVLACALTLHSITANAAIGTRASADILSGQCCPCNHSADSNADRADTNRLCHKHGKRKQLHCLHCLHYPAVG